jgi:hypothetical protein
MKTWYSLVVLLAASAGALSAQAVRGRLIEEGSDLPVVGALVQLQDSAGHRVGQAVSGSEGRYALGAPAAGSYILRVLRIGYLPFDSRLRLTIGETLSHNLVLTGVPVALPEIVVAGAAVCGARARGDTLSSALWTQAGTALAITAQTVQSRALRFETILENRNIDRLGQASPVEALNELNISAWPVRSPPPDTLLVSGFVENIEDVVVGPTWYGPDAEFLLSEPFFSGHCFWTIPPSVVTPTGWVGLAFEPAVTDQRTDIRGTLWLDRESGQLRRLDFNYTRVPKWARGFEAGGSLVFAPLPEGGWIVQRWMLRVPLPQRTTPGSMKVYGYRESGGHVRAVLNAQGTLLRSYDN